MSSIYRPKLKLPLSNFEIVIELVCIVMLTALFAGLFRVYPNLSDSVPTHFNAKGEVDSFGGKNSVFIAPLVALGIYLLLTLINRYPNLFNYPVKITQENAVLQYRLAKNYIAFVKLSVVLIFVIIAWNVVYLSLDKSKVLLQGTSFLIFLTLLLVLPFGYYIVQAKRNR